jgi:HlyD family secretion protein
MTRRQKIIWGVTALFVVIGAALLWMAPRRQIGLAQDNGRLQSPVIARGFTDAPAGQVVMAGEGSSTLLELRVVEGQRVKQGEVIAVLLNYPLDDVAVHTAEARLEQAKREHESLALGIRPTKKANQKADGSPKGKDSSKSASNDTGKGKGGDAPKLGIPEQEAVVRLSTEEHKLKVLEMQRSGLPAEERELEVRVSEEKSERDRAQLRVLKETLASDLAESEADISIKAASLENARALRERGLVRSPLNGIVVQVWTHPGERIERGIVQIVDMSQLRVLADIDEQLLGRVALGGKAQVVFRGEKTIHDGKIMRIGSTVKRMLSMGSYGTGTTNLNVVQVEVVLDDPSQMPEILGREALVTFF